MSAIKLLKYGYLAYFSKPKADREIYRLIRRVHPKAVVELGIGQGARTKRLLEQILEHQPADAVRYTGIDLFEARPADQPGLPLKQAHATFKLFGVKTQFIPGDPYSALARAANGLLGTDLILISADQDAASLARAWLYVPRMLHDQSLVLVEKPTGKDNETAFQSLSRAEVETLAQTAQRNNRRAA